MKKKRISLSQFGLNPIPAFGVLCGVVGSGVLLVVVLPGLLLMVFGGGLIAVAAFLFFAFGMAMGIKAAFGQGVPLTRGGNLEGNAGIVVGSGVVLFFTGIMWWLIQW